MATQDTHHPHRDFAAALRDLINKGKEKEADKWVHSPPVISIDEWAVKYAPELIREAEERTGVLHWSNRERNEPN